MPCLHPGCQGSGHFLLLLLFFALLPLKKARRSIRADCGLGLMRPLSALILPHLCYPPHYQRCYPLPQMWYPPSPIIDVFPQPWLRCLCRRNVSLHCADQSHLGEIDSVPRLPGPCLFFFFFFFFFLSAENRGGLMESCTCLAIIVIVVIVIVEPTAPALGSPLKLPVGAALCRRIEEPLS